MIARWVRRVINCSDEYRLLHRPAIIVIIPYIIAAVQDVMEVVLIIPIKGVSSSAACPV